MYDRNDAKTILSDLLKNTFGLSEETVSQFVSTIEQSGELELSNQRISTLPAELFDTIDDLIQYAANDTSVDNVELGDDSMDSTIDFYDQHVDDEECESNIRDLLNRLSGDCDDQGSLRGFIHRSVTEMNEVDVENTISNDANSDIDSATMRRINSLRDSGNNDAADKLAKQAMRRKVILKKKDARTPMDSTINAQKRQLAQSIERRNQLIAQGKQQER